MFRRKEIKNQFQIIIINFMKRVLNFTSIAILFFLLSCGGSKKITVSADPSAKLFVDGKQMSSGTTKIIVPKKSTVNVRVEKIGFITEERNFSNNKNVELPKTEFIKLQTDDAFESSYNTDIANRDIEVKSKKGDDEAWKLLNQIVTNYFDVIEVSDGSTKYLRTAWILKNFVAASVRTRLIIKPGSNNSTYKIKIVSEIAPPGTSVKEDERYREWDRLLRVYEPVVTEIQSRLTQ